MQCPILLSFILFSILSSIILWLDDVVLFEQGAEGEGDEGEEFPPDVPRLLQVSPLWGRLAGGSSI